MPVAHLAEGMDRFGHKIVDDWEGKVNSWPLDEGLIDYVAKSYGTESDENPDYTLNVIANPHFKIAGKDVDATKITPDLLANTLQAVICQVLFKRIDQPGMIPGIEILICTEPNEIPVNCGA